MTRQVKTHKALIWLIALLGVVLLAQSLVMFEMWKARSGRRAFSASFARKIAERLCSHDSRRPSALAEGDSKLLILQSPDELEDIHSRLNSILDELMADFEHPRSPLGRGWPSKVGPPALASERPARFMLDDIQRMQRELNTIFENAFFGPAARSLPALSTGWNEVATLRSMEFKDAGDFYKITIPMPDIDKTNIQIKLEGQLLSVFAGRHSSDEFQEQDRAAASFSQQTFETRIRLPVPVDVELAQAEYKDGILHIQAHKKKVAEGGAQIIEVK